jgi:hypothetical protein
MGINVNMVKGAIEMNVDMWEKQEVLRLLKGAPGTQYQEADESNKAIMRDWVRSLLQQQEITVNFVKADGTERSMKCTLKHDLIPPSVPKAVNPSKYTLLETTQEIKIKAPDPAVVKVYDLDAGGWRSFRMDRLKKISAEIVFDTK